MSVRGIIDLESMSTNDVVGSTTATLQSCSCVCNCKCACLCTCVCSCFCIPLSSYFGAYGYPMSNLEFLDQDSHGMGQRDFSGMIQGNGDQGITETSPDPIPPPEQ